MAVVPYTSKDISTLARLIRAEAEADGQLGELMVGNTGINRILSRCLDFKNIRTIQQMVYQSPGGFTSVQESYFYQPARSIEKKLAKRVIDGEKFWPASYALYFYEPLPHSLSCRSKWFGNYNTGRYKTMCYYQPTPGMHCFGQ